MDYQSDDSEENDNPQESTEDVDPKGFDKDNFMRWQLKTIRSSELDPSQDFAENDKPAEHDPDADPEESDQGSTEDIDPERSYEDEFN